MDQFRLSGGVKRSEQYTQAGISAWFVKATLEKELRTSRALVALVARASGQDGPSADGWIVEEIRVSHDLVVRWTTDEGQAVAVLLVLTMSEVGYNMRVAPGQVNRCLKLADAEPGLRVRRLTIAPALYFELVKDAKLATCCLSFEDVQAVATSRFKRLLSDGIARAERSLAILNVPTDWMLRERATIFASQVDRRLWKQVTG